jgi:glycosyltransferase involved in cell wall biosynthesis
MKVIEKKPKVSVCVVTYNQEQYIRKCLQSIVDQETDFEFEVIVGDDCSTDRTKEIINYFINLHPKKVKYFGQKKNVGPFKNLIDTCEKAKGNFIAHCDGDDFWLPNKLQAQIDFLEKNNDISGVFTNAVIGRNLINPVSDKITDISDALETIFTKSFFVRSSLLERKFDIKNIQNYFIKNNEIYDFEMYWLNHRGCKLMIMGTPYVNYNNDSNGISKNPKILEKYRNAIDRLKVAGLSDETYSAMLLDLNIIKYFLNPVISNKVNISSYVRARKIKASILIKLFFPAPLLRYLMSFLQRRKRIIHDEL